jgi:hypothetical protein
MSEKRPDLTCETIGHWLDRRISRWRNILGTRVEHTDKGEVWRKVRDDVRPGTFHESIISRATGAPLNYVKELLPHVAKLVQETAEDAPGRLQRIRYLVKQVIDICLMQANLFSHDLRSHHLIR